MEQNMTRGRIAPEMLRFMMPIFIGYVFQQFYNMVDSIIVGRFVSSRALAAVGLTGTIMFLVLGFSQGLTNGFAVLTSQAFGARDEKRVRHSVANGILLALLVTIAMTLFSLVALKPLLRLMNTPADVFDDAYTYISIICVGCAASIYYNLLTAYLNAVGNSRTPLLFLILSAGLNIVLDLIFTINLKMGVAGAAWATVLSQGISAVLTMICIYRKAPVLRPEKSDWHLDPKDSAVQMKIGLPMALQFAITAGGTMVMQSAINLFGASAISGFTAASKVQGVLTQGFVAMGVTATTFCGQNYGAGNVKRVRSGVRTAMLMMIVYSVIAAVLEILLLPSLSKMFFTADVDMAQMLTWEYPYIYESCACFIPLAAIFICRNSMQGCGYSLLPTLCGVVELAARVVTAQAAIAADSYNLAVAGDAVAWVTAGIFAFFAFLHTARDLEKKFPQEQES